jgi:hypothetical protein
MRAPRLSADSRLSRWSTPAPAAGTKPPALALIGRDALSGSGKAAAAILLALLAGTAQAATTADTLRRLPVQHDGRSMPLDTLAREAVWNVTGAYAWHGEDPVITVTGWIARACTQSASSRRNARIT